MNNIYLNQIDPLLQTAPYRSMVSEQIYSTPNPMPYTPKDYIGMLDERLRGLTETERTLLGENETFVSLSTTFNNLVQREIMNLIRTKLNSDGGVIDNINQQLDIINKTSNKVKEQERQNLTIMNDYITNFSTISFAEYQAMRNGAKQNSAKPIETVSETTSTEDGKKKFFGK